MTPRLHDAAAAAWRAVDALLAMVERAVVRARLARRYPPHRHTPETRLSISSDYAEQEWCRCGVTRYRAFPGAPYGPWRHEVA